MKKSLIALTMFSTKLYAQPNLVSKPIPMTRRKGVFCGLPSLKSVVPMQLNQPSGEMIMSNLVKLLMISIAAAIFAAPTIVNAEELRSVSCSVRIDYLWNGQMRAPYSNNFVINPGVVFEDDFSDRIHFRYFNASTSLVSGKTVVSIDYYNEQGAFWYVDFRPTLTLRDGGDQEETVSGSSSHYAENGVGEFTTDYTLTCRRLKL